MSNTIESAKEMIKAFNVASKHAKTLTDNIITDDLFDLMTDEQKQQVSELKKDASIFASDDMAKKEQIIKKYT